MSVQENTEYLKKTSGVHRFYVNVCPPETDVTAGKFVFNSNSQRRKV